MALLFIQMHEPALLRAFVIIFGSIVAATTWSPRPQSISLVLMALTSFLLFCYRRGKKTLPWLIPIFILWSNLHGGYILGLMLIALTAAGETLNHALPADEIHPLPWKRIAWLLPAGLACALVTLINPNGINIWLIPFNTISIHANEIISEWASPDFHNLMEQPLLWLLFATIAAIGLSKRSVDGVDLLELTWFAYMAFMARRNYGPFAIAVIPILSKYAWSSLTSIKEQTKFPSWLSPLEHKFRLANPSREFSHGIGRYINLSIIAFVAFAAVVKLFTVTKPDLVEAYETNLYPSEAIAYIQESSLPGNMVSEYNWGGYLTWYLRDYPVFLDSRTDLFGDEIIDQWITIVNANSGWQDIIDKWNIRIILLKADREIVQWLTAAGWQLRYQDDQAIVFSR